MLMNYKSDEGFQPRYAHSGDAGLDLRSSESVVVKPLEWKVIGTGLHIQLPENHMGLVMPRSGLAAKYGVTVLNSPGLIDQGYRGEIKVPLYNCGDHDFTVEVGDRIAQLVIAPFTHVELFEGSLEESERGDGGFGSTGVE